MKKKRTRKAAASCGQLYGVELFDDSRLLRVVMCQAHYDAVDEDDPFPLADVDDPAVTNANILLCLVRQHADDPGVVMVCQHRYFHRDSKHAHDGLDLKRRYARQFLNVDDARIDEIVNAFCQFAITERAAALCAPPVVYDFSQVPTIDAAIDAFASLPFSHGTIGGVQ